MPRITLAGILLRYSMHKTRLWIHYSSRRDKSLHCQWWWLIWVNLFRKDFHLEGLLWQQDLWFLWSRWPYYLQEWLLRLYDQWWLLFHVYPSVVKTHAQSESLIGVFLSKHIMLKLLILFIQQIYGIITSDFLFFKTYLGNQSYNIYCF